MPVKNIIPGQKVTKEKLERAKELRSEMTPAEKLLWQEVRAKKLGVRFRPPPSLPQIPKQILWIICMDWVEGIRIELLRIICQKINLSNLLLEEKHIENAIHLCSSKSHK